MERSTSNPVSVKSFVPQTVLQFFFARANTMEILSAHCCCTQEEQICLSCQLAAKHLWFSSWLIINNLLTISEILILS